MAKLTVEIVDELKGGKRMSPSSFFAMHEEPERHCNICDAVGHGYPGGGPCPLENTMSQADVDREDEEYRRDLEMRELNDDLSDAASIQAEADQDALDDAEFGL